MSGYAGYDASVHAPAKGSRYAKAPGVAVGPAVGTRGGGVQVGNKAAKGAAAKKGGRGFLGSVGHVFSQGGADLYHAAVNAPAALGAVAEAVGTDVAHSVTGMGKPRHLKTGDIAKAVAKQTAADAQHPLRHPGNTLLDALGLAGGLAGGAVRASEAARVASAGGKAVDVAKALAHAPAPPTREFQHGDLTVRGLHSTGVAKRAAEKVYDKQVLGRSTALNTRRVGKELEKNRRVTEAVERGPAVALVAAGNKLTAAEQTALRTVAEGTTTAQRIAYHQGRSTGVGRQERARHENKIALLHEAAQLLDETSGAPKIRAEHTNLQRIYDQTKAVAQGRDELLGQIGRMTPAAAQGRVVGPARVISGAQFVKNNPAAKTGRARGTLTGGGQGAGDFRVPYTKRRAPGSLGQHARVGAGGTIGNPRAPASLTQQFKGELLKQGNFRDETTKLVGESGMEAQRFGAVLRLREQMKKAAAPVPRSTNDVPMRLDNLKAKPMPDLVRQAIEEGNRRLTPGELAQVDGWAETVREHVFPSKGKPLKQLTADERASFETLAHQGKIAWVDRTLLRGLDKPSPRLEHVIGEKPTQAVDAINNAARFAYIYAKPSYGIPNALGNATLAGIQQGFAAIPNLVHSSRLNQHLGPKVAAQVDNLMGEGSARAAASQAGLGKQAVNKLAGGWSRVVDTPFRRSSFLHEARRLGYRTPDEIRSLIEDKHNRDDLVEVTRRANSEMIDYSNLSERERALVRRVVFTFPWVKGSTIYAGRLLGEHPTKAAVLGEFGHQQHEQSGKDLGVLPSYLEGILKVGEGKTGPLTISPGSASILTTPAQVAATLVAIAKGGQSKVSDPAGFASPATQLVTGALARQGLWKTLEQPVTSAPQYLLGQRLREATTGKGKNRIFPPTVGTALGQFLAGSVVTPRALNQQAAARSAASEKRKKR